MSNAVYPKFKEALLQAASDVSLNVNTTQDGVYCALIDTATYTYSAAHQFVNPSLTGIIGTAQRITSPTVTNGTLDGGDVTFTAVSGATIEALVFYRHNATADTTWRLVAYLDSGVPGLPVTPNGGDIVIQWDALGIFTI